MPFSNERNCNLLGSSAQTCLFLWLPAGHWVQSTAAAGCCVSAGGRIGRADLPVSSDQPGDFQLPGFRSFVVQHSRSNQTFSQCNSFSHWATNHGGTELQRENLSPYHTCRWCLHSDIWNTNLHSTCFSVNAEPLLQGYIEVFQECGHSSFGTEASARQEAFHCVLRLYLWWADVESMCGGLCVSVV